MNKDEKEEFYNLFESVIRLFQSRCWICRGKYSRNKSWVIHHKKYLRDSSGKITEKIYSDFKLSTGRPDRLNYHRYLIPIVMKDPKRFMLLHHGCHYTLGFFMRFKLDKLKRILYAMRMSRDA